ncbi:MAG: hypothetical protein H0X63_06650 [Flavobacteriales bacterium]|nr:hypothetical protein [Flavobacteriales bacterium]
MAGKYQNNFFCESDLRKIKQWISNNLKNNEWVNNLDLHLDEINIAFDNPDLWINAGLELLLISNNILAELIENNFISIVFFPLFAEEKAEGITFKKFSYIKKEFDLTPPSLFICPKNWIVLNEAFGERKIIEIFNFKENDIYVYFFEEKHDNGLEYVRNVSITSINLNTN